MLQQMDIIHFALKGYAVEKIDPEKIERVERKVERARLREDRARQEREQNRGDEERQAFAVCGQLRP